MSKYNDIIAGCDSVIYVTPKFLWLESDGKRTKVGRILEDKKYKVGRRIMTQSGDSIFGCCVDAIIRNNTIYEIDKPDWFYATKVGQKCRACRAIKFEGKISPDMLTNHCKGELRWL